jgi:ActR/RegA family two-component response regulator
MNPYWRILVVDDDEVFALTLAGALGRAWVCGVRRDERGRGTGSGLRWRQL